MEVNSQPSLCYIHEETIKDEDDIPVVKKIVSQLDKYLKTSLLKESIDLMVDEE